MTDDARPPGRHAGAGDNGSGGVAYTVPRCYTCRRWTPEACPDSIGVCAELARWTPQTFGCVAWEAKTCAS